jgi:AraC-like DNA-binding protein/ligand-binding sensor protein
MKTCDALFAQLSRSEIYHNYQQAFSSATKLPLVLRPPDSWKLVQEGNRNENPFCALLAQSNKGCLDCLRIQETIGDPAAVGATTAKCFAGLWDTAIPVRVGETLLGFLQTGQVALDRPSSDKFKGIAAKLIKWGASVDLKKLEEAYLHSHFLSIEEYSGAIRLLEIFASHMSFIGNQLLTQQEAPESTFTKNAKSYIAEHLSEPIDLKKISSAVHVSTFYFCKMFKKATGLTFTDYLARVRIEKSKALLLNPHARVSEIAYEVGFGSLTHFNRVFHRVEGQSPTEYRKKACHA